MHSDVDGESGLRARLLADETEALLGNAGFQRLYAGRMVSRIGDKLYVVAAMWLVFELTGSTLYTGFAGFLSKAPQALGFLAGPLVDRARLGRLLAVTEATQAVIVGSVPLAWWMGYLSVGHVLVVVTLLTVLRRVTAPAEQAALPRLVPEALLARANSIDSTTKHALGATAEALSGAIIAILGAVSLFAVNAATFVCSAVTFGRLDVPDASSTGEAPSAREYLDDVRSGFALVRHSVVGHMVVAAALTGVFTGMATAVLPAFAGTIGSDAETFGLLVGATTAGTLVGSLLAGRLHEVDFGQITVVGFLFAAAGRAAAAVVGWQPAVLLFYGAAAIPVGVYNVLVSAAIQTGVPNELLGRVSSTTGSLVAVVGPLGLLAGGVLGGVLDSATVVALSAVGYLCISAYWLVVPSLREFPAVVDVEAGGFGRGRTGGSGAG
ncbi:macrolide-efflux protein [Salinarchaeum sp. Harcht-Bsk1]|uniref:MFS transporter n=1 Tax=Salinarchaeum sp. Harcht-Bsk1 TaxID=1333523 RepID=UPI0003422A81|nr:MFS transporter [Salinarchaeum sp. Harcht-Bsk1]AGN00058.1 macrolide-efflux protein [Salinarchaeum sp. Harcht-Bsk1]